MPDTSAAQPKVTAETLIRTMFICFFTVGLLLLFSGSAHPQMMQKDKAPARPAIPHGLRTSTKVKTQRISRDQVTVYSCADEGCEVRGQLGYGETVNVYERVGGWSKVWSLESGVRGWMRNSPEATPMSPREAEVLATNLHFRTCGGLNCEIIGKLRQGEVILVLGVSKGWARAKSDRLGGIGWVSMKYIRFL